MNIKRRVIVMLVLVTLSVGYTAAQDDLPEPVLAVSTIPVLDPPLTADNAIERYTEAMELADDAGVTGNFISKTWSELEPDAGKYALDDLQGDLNYRTGIYNHLEMIGIQVINTTNRETPPDLLDVPFDALDMIERFQRLFDALLPVLNDRVVYFAIGNEVDAYLSAHPDEWQAYTTFYEASLAYIHQTAPQIKVGVTTTFNGAAAYPDQVADLNVMSDVFIMTYYPLNMDFTVRPPDAPLTDFPQMVAWAGEKPLLLQEVGYPVAESLGSSEAAQAEFVQHVFAAWEANAADIPFLSYFALGDFSEELCTTLTGYYGLPDAQLFRDYLCTLGLLTADGTPRAAWQAFVDEGQNIRSSHG